MTEQELIDQLEAHSKEIIDLAEADENTDVNGKWSIRKIVKNFINTLSRSWSPAREYVVDDLVSYSNRLYVARTCNINKNPALSTDDWAIYENGIVPGESAFTKTCVIREDQVIEGKKYINNIQITRSFSVSKILVNLEKAAPNNKYIVLVSCINKNTYETFDFGVYLYTKSRTSFEIFFTNRKFYEPNYDGSSILGSWDNIPYEVNISIKEV